VGAGLWVGVRSELIGIREEIAVAAKDSKPAAPVSTEPGCSHPDCVLDHPHAGPAILAKVRGTAEVGMRSPDSNSSETDDRYRRSFTLNRADLADVADSVHAANGHVVEREAINNGLSPELGGATFDGQDDVPGFPALVVLHYSVAVADGREGERSNG
jgi:hypothetical protein